MRTNKLQLLLITLMGCLVLTILMLPLSASIYFSNHISLHDRKGQAESVVNTAYYVIDNEHAQVLAGKKTEANAKQDAIKVISKIRFSDGDCVWIFDSQANMVSHPDEKLEGKSISFLTDTQGTNILSLVKQATEEIGFGFIEYWWPKPLHMDGASYEKISYVRKAAAWGWYIGAGIYQDDILFTMWQSKFRYFMLANISFVLVIICLFLHSKLVIRLTESNTSSKE